MDFDFESEQSIDFQSDLFFMGQALREASRAYEVGEVPIGAVIVRDGQVIARGWNQVETLKDATAHAEMLALTSAQTAYGDWRLEGATLYVTKEPCPMCAGAAVNARVARIVFGAWNPAYGACGSVWDLPRDRRLNHRPEVIGGVLAEEAGEVVSGFLAGRRD